MISLKWKTQSEEESMIQNGTQFWSEIHHHTTNWCIVWFCYHFSAKHRNYMTRASVGCYEVDLGSILRYIGEGSYDNTL